MIGDWYIIFIYSYVRYMIMNNYWELIIVITIIQLL